MFEKGVMLNENTSMKVISGTVEAVPYSDFNNAKWYNYWNIMPKGECEIRALGAKL